MSKVLKRMQFNNGYGCSCCRHDWEETEWIGEDEVPSYKDFFQTWLSIFDKNCSTDGCVGICYEKDGAILFGVTASIYRACWHFCAVKGDVDNPDEFIIPEVERKCGAGNVSFDLDAVWAFYAVKG